MLDLSSRGVASLGSLPECTNLLMLDLSHNQIMVISGLENFENLKGIDLSYNRITQLDALKGCLDLERLQVQGNQIKDTPTVEKLCVLPKLTHIYLREFNGTGPTPLCINAKHYSKKVLKAIPQLKSLDGQRVSVPELDMTPVESEEMKMPEYHSTE